MYVRYVATARPSAVRTIIVILSVRALIDVSLEQLRDRRFKRRRIGQRLVFELLHLLARLADQERWRAGEARVVRRLRVARDRVRERRVAARRRPARKVQPRYLLGQFLEVFLGHVARVLFALLVVEELDVVPHLLLLARSERGDLLRAERF